MTRVVTVPRSRQQVGGVPWIHDEDSPRRVVGGGGMKKQDEEADRSGGGGNQKPARLGLISLVAANFIKSSSKIIPRR